VRRLCPTCRIEVELDGLSEFFFEKTGVEKPEKVWRENPEGCSNCLGGSVGRMAIYELVFFDQSDQSTLYRLLKTSQDFEREFKEYLKEKYRFLDITEKAAVLAKDGEISIQEALKVL